MKNLGLKIFNIEDYHSPQNFSFPDEKTPYSVDTQTQKFYKRYGEDWEKPYALKSDSLTKEKREEDNRVDCSTSSYKYMDKHYFEIMGDV